MNIAAFRKKFTPEKQIVEFTAFLSVEKLVKELNSTADNLVKAYEYMSTIA